MIIVLGGMGSIGGALVAGILMITVEDMVSVIWGPVWSSLTFFLILVIILSVRPQGLFGKQASRLSLMLHRRFRFKQVWWLVALALFIAYPLIETNPAYTTIGIFTLIFMGCATSWNMFSGYSGYVISVLPGSTEPGPTPWHCSPFICTWQATRICSGSYPWVDWPRRSSRSLSVSSPCGFDATRSWSSPSPSSSSFSCRDQLLLYGRHVGLAAAVHSVADHRLQPALLLRGARDRDLPPLARCRCRRSRFGLQLLAIRDDEDRAAGLGVKVFAVKLTGSAMSAFAVGMGGALYAMFHRPIYPQFVFDPTSTSPLH